MNRPEWLRDPKYVTPFQLMATIFLWSRLLELSTNIFWRMLFPPVAWAVVSGIDLGVDLVRLWWEGRKKINPEKSC